MNKLARDAYLKRFIRVLDHIDRNLDSDLSLDCLSDIACFSRFHFHRQFSIFVGMSVHKYVRLARLKRASYRLVFEPDLKITDIAFDAHFENAESFSRAFKRDIGQSPSQFRKNPNWKPWSEKYSIPIREDKDMTVKIVEFEEINIAALEHKGPVETVKSSVGKFIEWRKANKLPPGSNRSFSIMHDDPKAVPPEDYRTDICVELKKPIDQNAIGIKTKTIPGGKCAVLRHHGSWDALEGSIRHLCGDWLPESGEDPADFPLFVEWVNLYPETPERDLITDIYLPLK